MSPRRALVVYADGPDGPLPDPRRLRSVAALRAGGPVEVVLGWVVRRPDWIDDVDVAVTTLLAGVGLRADVARGRVRALPTRLSSVPRLLDGRLRPDVAVVGAVADGRRWRAIGSVGWAPAAARAARQVVIEAWPGWPTDGHPPPATPFIDGHVVEVVERREPRDPPQSVRLGPADERIGELAASLVPAGATLQWGPGALGAAVVGAIDKPVAVRSGVVTDELVGLSDRGLLSGVAQAAYVWGGDRLASFAGPADGRLSLAGVELTHDIAALSAMERFVAVNTALEVGLDGAANVEMVGGRLVSGPGGHPDFSLAASRSVGGCSVVCVRAGGTGRPGIVVRPEVVTTARTDVDVVVSEHGIADLRGLDPAGRARAITAIADPALREELAAAASSASGLRPPASGPCDDSGPGGA